MLLYIYVVAPSRIIMEHFDRLIPLFNGDIVSAETLCFVFIQYYVVSNVTNYITATEHIKDLV